jgi:hypothetical protein
MLSWTGSKGGHEPRTVGSLRRQKKQGTHSTLETSKGTAPADTMTLARWNWFQTSYL